MTQSKVLIVLVLYKTDLDHSIAYQSMQQHVSALSSFQLYIYNNSPENLVAENDRYIVFNAKQNVMLSGAYNAALKLAAQRDIPWILLLDQDTQLTGDFFESIQQFLSSSSGYVAAVPILKQAEKTLSPICYNPTFGALWHKPAKIDSSNSPNCCVSAFNSATLLQVSFMQSIGGFSNQFPLDYLDYWYFYEIFSQKKHVCILDTTLQHTLSLANFSEHMTIERYKQFIAAEHSFIIQQGHLVWLLYKVRLIMRLCKQLMGSGMKPYAPLTLKSIFIR